MNRFQKRSFGIRHALSELRNSRKIGFLALMGFVLFVSFRIFTPPTQTVQVLEAPDGSRAARLQRVYYVSDPGFKVAVRERRFWHTLCYIPAAANGPAAEPDEKLRWSADSKQLILEISGTPVWTHQFRD